MISSPKILKIMMMRRSHRKFDPGIPPEEKFQYIKKCVEALKQNLNLSSGFVQLYFDKNEIQKIIRASFKGFVGKINPWLFRCGAPAFAVIGFETKEDEKKVKGHPFGFVESAYLGETMMLAATEKGIGSCWVGGINESEIRKALNLPEGTRISAISPLGFPYRGKSFFTWDRIANRLVSKRRKSLKEIVSGISFEEKGKFTLKTDREYFNFDFTGDVVLEVIKKIKNGSKRGTSFESSDEFHFNIFEAARIAPSAENRQPWRFFVATSKQEKNKIINSVTNPVHQNRIENSFSHIVVFSKKTLIDRRSKDTHFDMIDIPIAMLHILLVCAEFGYRCWVTFEFDESRILRNFTVKKNTHPFAIISIG